MTAFLGYITSPTYFVINLDSNFILFYNIDHLLSIKQMKLFIIVSSTKRINHITSNLLFITKFNNKFIRFNSRLRLASSEAKTPQEANKKNNLLSLFLSKNKLNPVFKFDDLNLSETRKHMFNNLKGLSGIYLIFNNITGDYYIGSASTGRFYIRYCNHLIHFTGSKVLKNAVSKYGIKNFTFLIIEIFPEIVTKENNKKLLDLEDFYLKSLLPNYNILTEAGNTFGYKHTELTRINMKKNYSAERREFIRNLNKDKTFSKETIEKMKEKAINRPKRIYTQKALMNMKKKI